MIILWLLLIHIASLGLSLNVRLLIPRFVRAGSAATLVCQYDLEGKPLYSVKWYRGTREFFRYIPQEKHPMTAFPIPGMSIYLASSNSHQVTLLNTSPEVSGNVTCEVSVEGSFRTASSSASLTILDVSKMKPYLNISNTILRPNEDCEIICQVPEANPLPEISFFINSQRVSKYFVKEIERGAVQLNLRELFRGTVMIDQEGYAASPLLVRCEASIDGFYSSSSPTFTLFPIYKSDMSSGGCSNCYCLDVILLLICALNY